MQYALLSTVNKGVTYLNLVHSLLLAPASLFQVYGA